MFFSAVVLSSVIGGFVGADIATKGESTNQIETSLIKAKDQVVEYFAEKPEMDCTIVEGATVETWLCQTKK